MLCVKHCESVAMDTNRKEIKKERKKQQKVVFNQCINEIEIFKSDKQTKNHCFPSTLSTYEKKLLHDKALEIGLKPTYIGQGNHFIIQHMNIIMHCIS